AANKAATQCKSHKRKQVQREGVLIPNLGSLCPTSAHASPEQDRSASNIRL
ncbi:hypothetical protein K491DRAFT_616097, partial [Lophiostoma macrostomum CBS 122681]